MNRPMRLHVWLVLGVLAGCGGKAEESSSPASTGGTAGANTGGSVSSGGGQSSGGHGPSIGGSDPTEACMSHLTDSTEGNFSKEEAQRVCSVCPEEIADCATTFHCFGGRCYDYDHDGMYDDCVCSPGAYCMEATIPELITWDCPAEPGMGGAGGSAGSGN